MDGPGSCGGTSRGYPAAARSRGWRPGWFLSGPLQWRSSIGPNVARGGKSLGAGVEGIYVLVEDGAGNAGGLPGGGKDVV